MQTSIPVHFDQKDQGTKYKMIELSEELARSLKEGDKYASLLILPLSLNDSWFTM